MKNENDVQTFRASTMRLMQCEKCRGNMLIGEAGLCCANGCGKILRPAIDWDSLELAWPERVVSHRRQHDAALEMTDRKARKLRKNDPELFPD